MDSAIFEAVIAGLHEHGNARRAVREAKANRSTLQEHLRNSQEAAAQYTRAKIEGIEAQAEALLDIADDMDIPADQKRIQVDTRKFLLSKLVPRVYGDKLELGGTLTVDVASILAERKQRAA